MIYDQKHSKIKININIKIYINKNKKKIITCKISWIFTHSWLKHFIISAWIVSAEGILILEFNIRNKFCKFSDSRVKKGWSSQTIHLEIYSRNTAGKYYINYINFNIW